MEDQNLDATGDGGVLVPTPPVVNLVLHLLAVRSAVKVGAMLLDRFPDEESMLEFCSSAETIEGLQAFVDARDDMTLLALKGETELAAAIRQHHPRAVESIDLLAEQIGVSPEDLFSFLMRG